MSENNYKFSFVTSIYTCVLLSFFWGIFLWLTDSINWWFLLGFLLFSFFLSFLIIQYRVEKFIYSRVKKIYNELDMIEAQTDKSILVNTDLNVLTKQVKDYAAKRKTELDTLKGREAYRKEFLGNVSHELKTPLFTVQGYILTLIDGAKNKPELLDKYLNRANKGVDRLNYIIQDLDLITQLEVGSLNLEYEDFDIILLIQNVFELIEMKAAKKNIALTFDMNYAPIMVNADKERIRQVVTNLIVNSVKYGNTDGTTEVSIQELIGSKMIIRVTDNGEGIEKQHIPRLFERFYRVSKSRSREEGGSGLGLAIVKHIVEAHNEHIYVDSIHGMGSEFSFTIEKYSPEASADNIN